VDRIKLITSENLNTSKSSIKQSSNKKYQKNSSSNNNNNSKSPKILTDSFTLKSKYSNLNLNQNSLHKHSHSSYSKEEGDFLNYRKKYKSKNKNKQNLKSKHGMLLDSDCQNIDTSQEFSPLADRSHYKSAFTAQNAMGGEEAEAKADKIGLLLSEKAEKNIHSICSKNSKNKFSRSFYNNNNNNNDNTDNNFEKSRRSSCNSGNGYREANKVSGAKIVNNNYSRAVYEENVLHKSNSNTYADKNHSILRSSGLYNNNKSAEEEPENEYTSKRVADIFAKTKSILGRSASREFRSRSKSKHLNKSSAEAVAKPNINNKNIIPVLKTGNTFAAVFPMENTDQENESNENNDFSDPEMKIKSKGFEKASSELSSAHKSTEKRKKSAAGAKSKSKSKSKSNSKGGEGFKKKKKKNLYSAEDDSFRASENLVTFTHNDMNVIGYYNTASRASISSRKVERSSAGKADRSAIFRSKNSKSHNKRLPTGSNKSFSINTYGSKSNINSSKLAEQNHKQEQILKLKERNNELKLALKSESKKHQEVEKKLKKIKFKEENFDCIEKNFIALQKEFEKIQKNYSQSELIRREQAKLIKSMKFEIELLKEGR